MAWTRNITIDELEELHKLKYSIKCIWIGLDEGYEFMSCHMGGFPFAWKKSPRAAYNACLKHEAKHNLKITDNKE